MDYSSNSYGSYGRTDEADDDESLIATDEHVFYTIREHRPLATDAATESRSYRRGPRARRSESGSGNYPPSSSYEPIDNEDEDEDLGHGNANDSLLHIQVVNGSNMLNNCIALLDTGCLFGNWISMRKVLELGMQASVDGYTHAPAMLAVDGKEVYSLGSIALDWKVTNVGTRMITTTFFIVDADHIDIIFGAQFLFSKKAVQIVINKNAFAPFVVHKKPSPIGEKQLIEQALAQQRRDKLEREQRRQLQEEARRQANVNYATWPRHDEV